MILFVIMLVKAEEDEVKQTHGQWVIAAFIALILVVEVAFIFLGSIAAKTGHLAAKMAQVGGNTEAVGVVLYTKYLFPFEVASILLLAAMIGAIVLAKYKLER